MKKDKKWFIDKWTKERDKTDVHDPMYHFINEFIADVKELDEPEVLSQELPVVPKFIADFIEARKNVFRNTLQYVFRRAMENRMSELFEEEYKWVRHNSEAFARAWLDGYTVEAEPLYYAMIKGHELLDDVAKYWAHNKYDLEDLFISYETRDDSPIVVKNTKNHWDDLGINDSNADFIKVEEVE